MLPGDVAAHEVEVLRNRAIASGADAAMGTSLRASGDAPAARMHQSFRLTPAWRTRVEPHFTGREQHGDYRNVLHAGAHVADDSEVL